MFICSCNALTDRDIEDAALASDGSVVDCYRQLGATPVCGCCMENAQDLIDNIRLKHTASLGGSLVRQKVEVAVT